MCPVYHSRHTCRVWPLVCASRATNMQRQLRAAGGIQHFRSCWYMHAALCPWILLGRQCLHVRFAWVRRIAFGTTAIIEHPFELSTTNCTTARRGASTRRRRAPPNKPDHLHSHRCRDWTHYAGTGGAWNCVCHLQVAQEACRYAVQHVDARQRVQSRRPTVGNNDSSSILVHNSERNGCNHSQSHINSYQQEAATTTAAFIQTINHLRLLQGNKLLTALYRH
jgi:hypothetical protein